MGRVPQQTLFQKRLTGGRQAQTRCWMPLTIRGTEIRAGTKRPSARFMT